MTRGGKIIVRAIDVAGRAPAHDDAMEDRCVGAVLDFGQRGLDAVLAHCRPEDLYQPGNRTILEAAVALNSRGVAVDTATVRQELESHGQLGVVGGVARLVALSGRCTAPESVEPYAKALSDLAHQRRVTEAAAEVHARGYEQSGDPASFVDFAAARMSAACERAKESTLETVGDVLDTVVPRLAAQWEGQANPRGMQTGFREYDQTTGGWHPGHLHVVAAYTGGGKSAFALQASTHIAGQVYEGERAAVLFIAGEMTKRELAERQLCQEARVTDEELQTGHGEGRDFPVGDVDAQSRRLSGLPIFFHDSAVSAHEVPGLVRAAQRRCDKRRDDDGRRYRVRLVVIDYLQIMRLEKADRLDIAIGMFTRACKQMAQDLGVHILLVSQFGREAAKKGGRPSMFDLRESGAIENDSNLITIVHRPSIAMEPESEAAKLLDTMSEFIVAKSRGRGKGSQLVAYRGPFFRFEEPTPADIDRWKQGRDAAKARGKS